ncbi:MAG: methionyl-tRNA formyltransferase [Candidatus Dormibacteria bacterium]
MKVIFFGTPEFAVPSVEALHRRHHLALVVSQPDRPSGRGMRVRPSPVAEAAESAGLPVLRTQTLRDPAVYRALDDARADVLVVVAFGQILPMSILGLAPHGGINVHASLLPRWRGASPVAAALRHGDPRTGISIMRMEAGLDTGPVLLQRTEAIGPADTGATLTSRLADLGAAALLEGLERLELGMAEFTPQSAEGVTHAGLVRKSDGDLDWDRSAGEVERTMRAFDPWPGIRLPVAGDQVRITGGHPLPAWAGTAGAAPGTVLETGHDGILVMAADAPFLVTGVQPAGRRQMPAADYWRGRR